MCYYLENKDTHMCYHVAKRERESESAPVAEVAEKVFSHTFVCFYNKEKYLSVRRMAYCLQMTKNFPFYF